MKLSNILVRIEGGTLGNLAVICDLLINQDEDNTSHPDNPIPSMEKTIDVVKIHSVELIAFDKVGITMTYIYNKDRDLKRLLEEAIIEEVEFTPIEKLQAA
jgi:hypothetical protein